jgi:NitT/TauT family transport system permease protein
MLFCWEFLVKSGILPEYVVSSPTRVLVALRALISTGSTWSAVGVTFSEVVGGLLIGCSTGLLLGIVAHTYSVLYRAGQPLVTGLSATPRVAVIPIFAIWFGTGHTSEVSICAFEGFVVFWWTITRALHELEGTYGSALAMQGASLRHRIRFLYCPGSVSYLVAAFRQTMALAFGVVVIAEFLVATDGLGHLIAARLAVFDNTGVIALLILVAGLAVVLDQVARIMERLSTRWR